MRLLGIDYGQKKIGLAISEGRLAEPLKVLKYEELDILIKKILVIIENESIKKIIVGISEGKMASKTKKFGQKLEGIINVPVIFQDETLTTQDAQKLAIEGKINRKKRKSLEDAYAATLILQSYLDTI